MTEPEMTRDGRSGATPLLFVLVGLLLCLGIGLPLAMRLKLVRPISPVTIPVPGATNVVIRGRGTPSWATLNRASQAYLQREGPSRRGPLFEQAAAQLSVVMPPGMGYSAAHVSSVLGDPDYLADSTASGGGILWAYLYDKEGTRNANVIVHFDRNRTVELVRFGKHSAADFSDWQVFGTPATRPATAPAADADDVLITPVQ